MRTELPAIQAGGAKLGVGLGTMKNWDLGWPKPKLSLPPDLSFLLSWSRSTGKAFFWGFLRIVDAKRRVSVCISEQGWYSNPETAFELVWNSCATFPALFAHGDGIVAWPRLNPVLNSDFRVDQSRFLLRNLLLRGLFRHNSCALIRKQITDR